MARKFELAFSDSGHSNRGRRSPCLQIAYACSDREPVICGARLWPRSVESGIAFAHTPQQHRTLQSWRNRDAIRGSQKAHTVNV